MVGGYVATGYSHAKKEWIGPGNPPLSEALKKGIKLGLDLRGGIHLVLQVNTADAVKAERDDARRAAPDAGARAGRRARRDRVPLRDVLHRRRHAADGRKEAGRDREALAPGLERRVRRRQVDLHAEGRRPPGDRRQRRLPGDRDDPQPRRRVRRRGAADRPRGHGPDPRAAAGHRRSQARQGPDQEHGLSRAEARREGALDGQGRAPRRHGRTGPADMELVEGKAETGQRQTSWYLVKQDGRDHGPGPEERAAEPRPVRRQLRLLLPDGRRRREVRRGDRARTSASYLAIILDKRVQSAPVIHERITDQGQINGKLHAGGGQRPRARPARRRAPGRA